MIPKKDSPKYRETLSNNNFRFFNLKKFFSNPLMIGSFLMGIGVAITIIGFVINFIEIIKA